MFLQEPLISSNQNLFDLCCSLEDASGFLVSLLFGLGPLLGGMILVVFSLAFYVQHSLLTGVASGIAFLLAAWRPLQLLLSSKMGFFTLTLLLISGSDLYHMSTASILRLARRKVSVNDLASSSGLSVSVRTLQSLGKHLFLARILGKTLCIYIGTSSRG